MIEATRSPISVPIVIDYRYRRRCRCRCRCQLSIECTRRFSPKRHLRSRPWLTLPNTCLRLPVSSYHLSTSPFLAFTRLSELLPPPSFSFVATRQSPVAIWSAPRTALTRRDDRKQNASARGKKRSYKLLRRRLELAFALVIRICSGAAWRGGTAPVTGCLSFRLRPRWAMLRPFFRFDSQFSIFNSRSYTHSIVDSRDEQPIAYLPGLL